MEDGGRVYHVRRGSKLECPPGDGVEDEGGPPDPASSENLVCGKVRGKDESAKCPNYWGPAEPASAIIQVQQASSRLADHFFV
jgi:hypothetical protein